MEQRAALIREVAKRLTEMNLADPLPFSSLTAAEQRLSELEPADFVSFTEAWLTSIAEWRRQLSLLPRVNLADKARAIEKAVAKLDLAEVVRVHELPPQGVSTKQTGWIGGFAARWGRRAGADGLRVLRMPNWF